MAIVLRVFLDDPREPRYGYELMRRTEFPSGKIYPILARLRAAGWLDRTWESVDPVREGRPARCWYRLSEEGIVAARQELAARRQRPAPYRLRPAWQVGGGEL